MKRIDSIGIQIPQVHLPRPGIDLSKWGVIACDQFTSEPEYWASVEQTIGGAPSAYRLILPEVYLGQPDEPQRISTIQASMRQYLDQGVLLPHDGLIYIERTTPGKTRRGLILALDLERYDFNKGSQSLIRATEGTILERLPPRMKIREGAPLELPHILVLIDDPACTVIEPLAGRKPALTPLYDFDLMLGSGHLSGWLVEDAPLEAQVVSALEALSRPQTFQKKYAVGADQSVLLFAMGDGNHSLATAKAIWEKIKAQVGMDHPARYALVEIENVHDAGLDFEPIHRVLFGVQRDPVAALCQEHGDKARYTRLSSAEEMVARVDENPVGVQRMGVIRSGETGLLEISGASSNLPVGTLQTFLDGFLKSGGAEKIDYVHGADVVARLGAQPGNLGFYLPAMDKSDLFKTVILDGALPRKTFSMGEAREKRFYVEARKIN
ncbi:MAG TPA: DUF1015 domain-containing protein [Anaerolineaceae bacterium]|jgi:hypothetical protein